MLFSIWRERGWENLVVEERFGEAARTILSLSFTKMSLYSDIIDKDEVTLSLSVLEIHMNIEGYVALMDFLGKPRTRKELQEFCGYKSRDYFRSKIFLPLINAGKIEMTIPDKPQSSKQRYVRHGNI